MGSKIKMVPLESSGSELSCASDQNATYPSLTRAMRAVLAKEGALAPCTLNGPPMGASDFTGHPSPF